MAIIFWGAVYPTLEVLPQMRARRAGRIVTITSIGGKVSVPHLLPYSAAKFAVTGFSEGLRAELARSGIAVVTVVPWLMRTGSHLNAEFKGQHRREFGWFSLGATLPGVSISAEKAARQIVGAIERGDAELILGWQASLVARVHGLMPGLTADVLGVVNQQLAAACDRVVLMVAGLPLTLKSTYQSPFEHGGPTTKDPHAPSRETRGCGAAPETAPST